MLEVLQKKNILDLSIVKIYKIKNIYRNIRFKKVGKGGFYDTHYLNLSNAGCDCHRHGIQSAACVVGNNLY